MFARRKLILLLCLKRRLILSVTRLFWLSASGPDTIGASPSERFKFSSLESLDGSEPEDPPRILGLLNSLILECCCLVKSMDRATRKVFYFLTKRLRSSSRSSLVSAFATMNLYRLLRARRWKQPMKYMLKHERGSIARPSTTF